MISGVHFSHLFIRVKSLAAARAFYVDLLGFEVLLEEPGYLRVGSNGGFHVGMEEDPATAGSDDVEINLRVPDVDIAYRQLTGAGVIFESQPQDTPWGARHAWLRDPSGHPISLFSDG